MKIVVADQWSSMIKDETLIEKSEKLYIVEFIFDRSWMGFEKTAIFNAGHVTEEVPLLDDRCIIPSKCLEQAGTYLRIGVYGQKDGEKRAPIWCLTSKILYRASMGSIGADTPGGTPGGTPSVPEAVRAQVIEVIRTNTATDEEVDEVLDKTFGEDYEPPAGGGSGASSNTVTDEEVDDLLNDVFG